MTPHVSRDRERNPKPNTAANALWARAESTTRPWLSLEGDAIVSQLRVDDDLRDTFEAMTEEMIAMRLRQHVDKLTRRQQLDATQAPILLNVSHAGGRPILRFDRTRRPDIPEGDVPVEVDGEDYLFKFRKIAVNVATGPLTDAATATANVNVMPKLMRAWFGPTAGWPGTRHRVELTRTADRWRLTHHLADDQTATAIPFPRLPFYPDLEVACGALQLTDKLSEASTHLAVRTTTAVDPKHHFIVRAKGDSMDGGDRPIRDGDLVLCAWWTNGATAADIEGKPFLLIGHDTPDTSFAAIKIPIRQDGRWLLRSTCVCRST